MDSQGNIVINTTNPYLYFEGRKILVRNCQINDALINASDYDHRRWSKLTWDWWNCYQIFLDVQASYSHVDGNGHDEEWINNYYKVKEKTYFDDFFERFSNSSGGFVEDDVVCNPEDGRKFYHRAYALYKGKPVIFGRACIYTHESPGESHSNDIDIIQTFYLPDDLADYEELEKTLDLTRIGVQPEIIPPQTSFGLYCLSCNSIGDLTGI